MIGREKMNINDYAELMKNRQSCREFDSSKPIKKEDLIKILELSKLSPSACNSQPYSVFVAMDDVAKQVRDTKVGNFNSFIDECNAFFIITEARYTLPSKIGSMMQNVDFKAIDIGIFTANLVNAATCCGIETCILGMFNKSKLKKIISCNDVVRLVIALGYPKDGYQIREKKRKEFDSNVHFL